MQITSSLTGTLIWCIWFGSTTSSYLPSRDLQRGPGEVARNGIAPEPSCEELKAMWRLSKRQSRASELTNEIPTFQDPFTHNIWQPKYATSRSMGGMRMHRHRTGPVFGKIIHTARLHDAAVDRNRAFEELTQNYQGYGMLQGGVEARPRPLSVFRMAGGGNPRQAPGLGYPQRAGSFQYLKELIKTERARELHEQKMAEEEAARVEALRSLTHYGNQRASMYPDMDDMEDQPVPEPEHYIARQGIIHFPDLLAPSARHQPVEQYIEDYGYPRIRPKSPDSFIGSSFAYTDYDGFYI